MQWLVLNRLNLAVLVCPCHLLSLFSFSLLYTNQDWVLKNGRLYDLNCDLFLFFVLLCCDLDY